MNIKTLKGKLVHKFTWKQTKAKNFSLMIHLIIKTITIDISMYQDRASTDN